MLAATLRPLEVAQQTLRILEKLTLEPRLSKGRRRLPRPSKGWRWLCSFRGPAAPGGHKDPSMTVPRTRSCLSRGLTQTFSERGFF